MTISTPARAVSGSGHIDEPWFREEHVLFREQVRRFVRGVMAASTADGSSAKSSSNRVGMRTGVPPANTIAGTYAT